MDRVEAVSRLRTARVARLATVRPDGRPHVVPIVFTLIDEGQQLSVYWSVDRKPKRSTELQRLRNISVNPHVELVVDGYHEAWELLWWVRATGTSRTVEDANESARALAALTTKYPQYVRSPPVGPTVAIEVAEITGWQAAPSATG
ncbi:MAG: TIGR03668 family PPOX class F420-dependent oxidoreductase [Actinomycetota bacterium]